MQQRLSLIVAGVLSVVTLIIAIGVVMIFSTTSADLLDHDRAHNTHQALIKQTAYAIMGVCVGLIAWGIGYRRLLRFSPLLLWICVALLILTLIPGIGRVVNGSRRWLDLFGISMQPSEFAKYVVPAYFIQRFRPYLGTCIPLRDFLHVLSRIAIPIILILVEPNNGTAAVVAMTVVLLCLLMGITPKYWALPLAVFVVLGGFFAMQLPYVTARLQVYLHPELDLKGKGHQPYQAKIAAGSGKLFGKGPGNSWQKLSYLPEAQNDYIAAIYAEEFGFLGICTLIFLYMLLGYLGFYISWCAIEPTGLFIAASVTFLLCFQAFLNLGVVSGLLPSTGLNLPLFSQGGTSLVANMMGIGFLLSVVGNSRVKRQI